MNADIVGDLMIRSPGAIKQASSTIGCSIKEYMDHGRREEVHCSLCKTWKHKTLISYRPKAAVLSGVCKDCNRSKTSKPARAAYMRAWRLKKQSEDSRPEDLDPLISSGD